MIIGRVDKIAGEKLYGWAFEQDAPDEHVSIEIICEGNVVANALASIFRADLKSGGFGAGDHAFEIELPKSLREDAVRVRAKSSVTSCALDFANADEHKFSELFDIITKRYDALFSKMLSRVEAGEKQVSSIKGNELADRCKSMEDRVSELSSRVDSAEVFLLRIDEIARKLVESEKKRVKKRFWGFF